MTFEAKIITFLQSGISEGWTVFFKTVSLFGSFLGAIILFLVLFSLDKRFSIVFGITYCVGIGLNTIIKKLFMRVRPYETYSTIQGLVAETGSSMPSGHAVSVAIIAVFSIIGAMLFCKTKQTKISIFVTMFIFVGLVCLSRMYLGVHYLTDVIAGVTLGFLIAILGFFTELKILEAKFGGGKSD